MISDPAPTSGFPILALNRHLKALHDADWEDPHGAIRLRGDLPLADLAGATILQNARVFLRALSETDGTPTTGTGNLNRVFVARMLDELCLGATFRESTRSVCKVINEMDVWPLHEVRVVAELGKLVVRRKNHFRVTRPGREGMTDEKAGTLYRHLFITFFRKLDLHYVFHFREVPGIQQTMAIILWRLADVAHEWRAVKGIARQLLPPRVFDQMQSAKRSPYDTDECIMSGLVLTPLLDFGLIERQRKKTWTHIIDEDVIRVTALFRRFVSFAALR